MEYITLGNEKVKVETYETSLGERDLYGINVCMFIATCSAWEYYMPSGTIRDKTYRDVDSLWGAFIWNDKKLLADFIEILSSDTGYNIHIANKASIPPSVYKRLTQFGLKKFYGDGNGDCAIKLIIYANNK